MVNLAYDPLGRLWQVSSSSGTTQFLYDGDHEALEYDANRATLWRYFFGPGADEPIIADQGGSLNCNNTRFLHVDHQGSMIATDDCSGNRATVATYDEYGIPGASNWGRFQYTGHAYIAEIGMYYYKARIYSPTLGRFLQTDRIGYDGGINIYEYALDDPVDHEDPSGNCPKPGEECTDPGPQAPKSSPKVEGSTVVGVAATAQSALADGAKIAAKGNGGVGVRVLKGYGVAGAAIAAGMDAKSQMNAGKPVDKAIANAGGRAAITTGVGAVAGAGAAAMTGVEIIAVPVAAVVSVGVELWKGKSIGNTAESWWSSLAATATSGSGDGGGVCATHAQGC